MVNSANPGSFRHYPNHHNITLLHEENWRPDITFLYIFHDFGRDSDFTMFHY